MLFFGLSEGEIWWSGEVDDGDDSEGEKGQKLVRHRMILNRASGGSRDFPVLCLSNHLPNRNADIITFIAIGPVHDSTRMDDKCRYHTHVHPHIQVFFFFFFSLFSLG
jgi:hypothetical protein